MLTQLSNDTYLCSVCGKKTSTKAKSPRCAWCSNPNSPIKKSSPSRPGDVLERLIKLVAPLFRIRNLVAGMCQGCTSLKTQLNQLNWWEAKQHGANFRKQIVKRWIKKAGFWPPMKGWLVWVAYVLMLQIVWLKERKATKLEKREDLDFVKSIETRLNGRTLDEALLYLEKCKECAYFRQVSCSDFVGSLPQRLATGHCPRWNRAPKNSIAYRFFTSSDLVQDSFKLIRDVPQNVEAVVGSARSGLIPATNIATQLHLPLFAVNEHTVVDVGAGWRLRHKGEVEPKKVLYVEDTVYGGSTITRNLALVKSFFPSVEVVSAAVYVHPKSLDKVDLYVVELPGRHYLEWNFFNSVGISRSIFDFDGILCEDISPRDDDDGERYLQALRFAKPKYLVRREPIPIIVTARLEKYRGVTEEWLEKYGISCKKLIMGPWANNKDRSQKLEISKFKASVYSSYSYTLFVESDPHQAREIVELSGKEVLCPTLKRVLIK